MDLEEKAGKHDRDAEDCRDRRRFSSGAAVGALEIGGILIAELGDVTSEFGGAVANDVLEASVERRDAVAFVVAARRPVEAGKEALMAIHVPGTFAVLLCCSINCPVVLYLEFEF